MGGNPIVIDGSHGEGGGQILRTSLGLVAALGRSIRITNIRAARREGGLRPQHLAAARAAAAVCNAEIIEKLVARKIRTSSKPPDKGLVK